MSRMDERPDENPFSAPQEDSFQPFTELRKKSGASAITIILLFLAGFLVFMAAFVWLLWASSQ
jgi:hypothetical protein